MLDSQPWKCVEAVPAIAFGIEGESVVRPRRRTPRLAIQAVFGRVSSVDEGRIQLSDGDDVVVELQLPEQIDLAPLLGERIHVTLRNEPLPLGPMGQTLTITDAEGGVKLIAHFGRAEGDVHELGFMSVRVALSQRPGGPIVFGTSQLQCVVNVGEHVGVRDAANEYVMHFVARTATSYAAYVIADCALWRSHESTRSRHY